MVAIDESDVASLYRARGHDSAPAYQRVKNLIAEQIVSGRWPQGDQLPSENQLVNTLGLSRMTVNRALRELTADGLVVRLMGVGTFVAERKVSSALFEVRNIADEVVRRGHRHRSEVDFVRAEPADALIAHQLGVPDGSPVFHSRLVHFEDDLAIQVEDRHVNPQIAPDYLDQDFTVQTPNTYLMTVAPLGRGEHVVESVLGTPEECVLLGIPETEPCLLIHRRTWSEGKLVSTARLVHPGSRYRLEGTFDAQ
ncbi:histidine utilization repressor [Rhodococcus sp. NPDC059234]|uniref:histidine utilization repressor n=1 Tax=Rhodococcus sp. NPDC059234 TaxID=3346781 RepID=UPI00366F696A